VSYEDEVDPLREEIDRLNVELLDKLRERVEVALRIGEAKKRHGLPIVDRSREEKVLDHVGDLADDRGLDPAAVRRVFREIIDLCVEAEEKTQ
jgi:monofunctional chorismate mutase